MADEHRQLADEVARLVVNDDHVQVHMHLDHADAQHIAALLLPLLDRVAADAAAEALVEMADLFDHTVDPKSPRTLRAIDAAFSVASEQCRTRAAELRALARTDEEN